MADYVPNTVVKVLKNVPCDNTYTDVRWFASAGEQSSFFSGKAKYTFTNMTYQRVNNSVATPRIALSCRVPRVSDDLYDCNYIMFQNSNYGSKWFYAFIERVNYINPNNTEIIYQIDYFQTFMFDMEIKPSFVLREHASAAEDDYFMNLVPEPIAVNEYKIYEQDSFNLDKDGTASIVIAVVPNSVITGLLGSGAMYSGIYSGAVYMTYPATTAGASSANTFIAGLAALDQANAICDVFMTPLPPQEGLNVPKKAANTQINTKPTAIGSHTIRNKKLASYPFSYIEAVSNSSGEVMVYRPEFCVGDSLTGTVQTLLSSDYSLLYTPAYMGINENKKYSLAYNATVKCVWNSSAYANAGLGMAIDGIKLTASAAMTLIPAARAVKGAMLASAEAANMGLALKKGKEAIGHVADFIEGNGETLRATATQRGSVGSNQLNFALKRTGFEFYKFMPEESTAERIDTYFDMYGYAKEELKMPNLKTRESWNYVQLANPCIVGSVPVEGMAIIKQAFSNGVRLWHVNDVGNYSLSNAPI